MPQPAADASVRAARAEEAAALAGALGAVQARAWRAAYADVLPAAVLASWDVQVLAPGWREAIAAPPSARHRVLVARAGEAVVGFVALGPSEDADLTPAHDAELLAFVVDPSARQAGHGSRLLAASVDTLRELGFQRAVVWVDDMAASSVSSSPRFLASAGWAADGARRRLDLDGDGVVVVPQSRWHTDLRP